MIQRLGQRAIAVTKIENRTVCDLGRSFSNLIMYVADHGETPGRLLVGSKPLWIMIEIRSQSSRDVLEADLRRRHLDTYADIHRRLRGYLVDQVKTSAGNPAACSRRSPDLLILIRDHPGGRRLLVLGRAGRMPRAASPAVAIRHDHRHDP